MGKAKIYFFDVEMLCVVRPASLLLFYHERQGNSTSIFDPPKSKRAELTPAQNRPRKRTMPSRLPPGVCVSAAPKMTSRGAFPWFSRRCRLPLWTKVLSPACTRRLPPLPRSPGRFPAPQSSARLSVVMKVWQSFLIGRQTIFPLQSSPFHANQW